MEGIIARRDFPRAGTEDAVLPKPARYSPAEPDDEFQNIEEFRCELLRRLKNLGEAWRRCPASVCRRAHACAHPEFRCRPETPPPSDPVKTARVLARLRRRLESLGWADEAEDQDAVQRRR